MLRKPSKIIRVFSGYCRRSKICRNANDCEVYSLDSFQGISAVSRILAFLVYPAVYPVENMKSPEIGRNTRVLLFT